MRYRIHHAIHYTYSQPVELGPHTLRLRPRCDGSQVLHDFQLQVSPQPLGLADIFDLEGNTVIQSWFNRDLVESLQVEATSIVETLRSNPFHFLLEPWALSLPFDYPASTLAQVRPYLSDQRLGSERLDPAIWELAQGLLYKNHGNTLDFLGDLNQTVYNHCFYQPRETGDPMPPGMTWRRKTGSCRDLSVLFMEVCRVMGLAARFVSGYEAGDPKLPEKYLHAWVEVFLPGAGWRGYDPTQGLVTADRHIPLAASAFPQNTAPMPGTFRGRSASAHMTFELEIEPLDSI
ncbi:MAG: transglutaminase family protein [Limnothrix sp. CACIAM 69d]|nr:MAG: transglutaminase family protein [Limnothrix sp. CACIAM 69d]